MGTRLRVVVEFEVPLLPRLEEWREILDKQGIKQKVRVQELILADLEKMKKNKKKKKGELNGSK